MEPEIARKGDKRERTRAKLIEAALAVAAEKGFVRASLDEIAARAGMTKGSIYSNFEGKADLMLAAVSPQALITSPRYEAGAPLKRQMRIVAEAVVALLPRTHEGAGLRAEFQLYAMTDPELRARMARTYEATFDQIEGVLNRFYGDSLAMPARAMAVTMQSLGMGFLYQHVLTPEAVTPEVVIAAYEALAG